MKRLRITFARAGAARYLSHLELMKAWERSFRRAGWKLAYSAGFNPHPRMSFAAALPVGVAAEADLIEVFLESPLSREQAMADLAEQLPAGLAALALEEVPEDAAPMQRQLRSAEYVALCPGASREALATAVQRVVEAKSLPRRRAREGKGIEYDLRPLIRTIELKAAREGQIAVAMTLRTDAEGAGRADEVLRELGLDPADCEITRTRLLLEE